MQAKLRRALAIVGVLAMLCTLLPLGAVSVSAADKDLLVNGDFETGNGNGWDLDSGTSVSTDDVHGGSYAVKTTATSTKYQGMLSQTLEVQKNTDYVWTFWYKYVGSNASPAFYALLKDAAETTNLNDSNSRISAAKNAWTQVSITVNSGDNSTVVLSFANRVDNDGGTYYFDDVTFVGPEPTVVVPGGSGERIVNGTFESGNANGWIRGTGTDASNEDAYEGSYSLKTTATASKYQDMAKQAFDVVPNSDYTLTFWFKYVGNNADPQFYAYAMDAGEGQITRVTHDVATANVWTKVALTWNSGSNEQNYLKLQNRTAGDGGTYYFDNISVIGPDPNAVVEPENPVPEVPGNLTRNGNFETGDLSGWNKFYTTAAEEAAYSGYYGAKVVGDGSWGGTLNQTVPVEAGKTYEVAMWLKTVSKGTNIQIKDGGENGTKLAGEWFTKAEWTYVTYTVTPTTGSLFINFSGGNTGVQEIVYLDDLTVTKAPLITNGGFETGDKSGWSCNSGTATIVSDANSGNYALQLENPGYYGEAAIRTIGVKTNTQYEVSWYAKRVSGTGVFNLVVSQTVSPWAGFEKLSGQNWMNETSGEWVKYTCVYNSGDFNQMLLKFTAEAANAGSIIIDDVTVTELKNPTFDGFIYNGDFETGKTSGWNLEQNSAIDQTAAYHGDYGLHLMGAANWNAMAYQDFTTEVGKSYYFYAYLKTDKNGANVRIVDNNNVKITSTWFNKTSWTLVTLNFVATSTTTRITFAGAGSGVAESVYVDDAFITEVKLASNDGYVINGDFEAGSLVGWTTHQSTLLSLNAAYDGTAGVDMIGSGWGGTLNQTVYLDMGTDYKVSFWFKPISNGLNFQLLDENGERITSAYLATDHYSDWTLYETTFNSGYNTKVKINFCGSGAGSTDEMCVDNVQIVNLTGEENVLDEALSNKGVSVRDVDDAVRGLAFRFYLDVTGAQVTGGNIYQNGTGLVKPLKNDDTLYTLVHAGAVVTNDAAVGVSFADFTLDSVDGKKIVDVPAVYLTDMDSSSIGYAVRVIDIPDSGVNTEIYARPYYIYEDENGQQITVYGRLSHDSYNGVLGEHKSVNILAIGDDDTASLVEDYLPSVMESADYDRLVVGNLYNDATLDAQWAAISGGEVAYTYAKYQYGDWTQENGVSALTAVTDEEWDYIVILPSENEETYENLAAIVNWLSANSDAPIYWNMTDAEDAQDTVSGVSGIDGIIPSATAIASLEAVAPGADADYVSALTWYVELTGESLDEVEYYPATAEKDFFNAARAAAHAYFEPYTVADLSETVLIAGSDFQPSTWDEGRATVNGILGAMANDGYTVFDGFFSGGDYATGTGYEVTTEGLAVLDGEISKVVNHNKVYSEGNHDVPTTVGLSPYGNNDPFGGTYGIFAIHEENYGDLGDGGEQVGKDLTAYFNEKLQSGWGNKPIFVLCHIPLNYSMRTIVGKNARTAMPIVEACNAAGEAGLNVIFLYGHNHSSDYDAYIGGGAVYLKKGDTMLVPSVLDYTVPQEVELRFTYMNAGYIGYYRQNSYGSDTALTMTLFRIQADGSVIIARYDANGIHNLKSEGKKNTDKGDTFEPDPTVYESSRIVTADDDRKYEEE